MAVKLMDWGEGDTEGIAMRGMTEKLGEWEGELYTTMSREGGRVGRWCSQREALPCQRAMARRPKRWLLVVAGTGEPDL